jgi:hypothetical protein
MPNICLICDDGEHGSHHIPSPAHPRKRSVHAQCGSRRVVPLIAKGDAPTPSLRPATGRVRFDPHTFADGQPRNLCSGRKRRHGGSGNREPNESRGHSHGCSPIGLAGSIFSFEGERNLQPGGYKAPADLSCTKGTGCPEPCFLLSKVAMTAGSFCTISKSALCRFC